MPQDWEIVQQKGPTAYKILAKLDDPWMSLVDILIYSWYIPWTTNLKWRPLTAHLYFQLRFWSRTSAGTHSVHTSNFVKIGQRGAESLQFKVKFRQKWPIFLIGQFELAYQNKLFVIYFIKKLSLKSEVWR